MTLDDEAFYRKHARDLSRLAAVMVGPADGHDVFTDAMLRVFRSPRWPELSSLEKRAYAYRAVVNEARSWSRSMGRRRRREAIWCLQRDGVVSAELDPRVWDAVADLSPRQRAVVYLTFWADLDGTSAAAVLGISEGSVRQHLDRARRKLRRRLDV